MQRILAPVLLVPVLLASAALSAQAGNEVVFVGSSTSGSTDLHAFVGTGPATLLASGPSQFTDNVSDAVWTDRGRTLFVSQSIRNRVAIGAWNGVAMSWSQLHLATGACYGLGHDIGRKRLWTLVSSPGSAELRCIDADPSSPSYGAMLAQTTTLSGPIRERWSLSPSGNFAVVPHGTVNTGLFEIVDTDPASASFLQVVVSVPMPAAQASGFAFAFDCKVSLDELYCYVLYAGFGSSSLAVFDRSNASFLDFQPNVAGQQDLALGAVTGNSLALSVDRSFALVSSAQAVGRVLRVDFDYAQPGSSAVTTFATLAIPYAHGVTLSPEGARAAVTSTAQSVGGPGKLVVFDPATGGELATVPLGSMWNLYTTAWQDESPNGTFSLYGGGCPGALGEPSLAAAPGQRPRLGTVFSVEAGSLPFGVTLLAFGMSNTSANGLSLPMSLQGIGMPGCSLLVDPQFTAAVVAPGATGTFALAIPNDPTLFRTSFFCQSFPLDPNANSFGFTASPGADVAIGL